MTLELDADTGLSTREVEILAALPDRTIVTRLVLPRLLPMRDHAKPRPWPLREVVLVLLWARIRALLRAPQDLAGDLWGAVASELAGASELDGRVLMATDGDLPILLERAEAVDRIMAGACSWAIEVGPVLRLARRRAALVEPGRRAEAT